MVLTVLRFNFASPHGEPRTQSKLLSAALELVQWGESHGITTVSVDEEGFIVDYPGLAERI